MSSEMEGAEAPLMPWLTLPRWIPSWAVVVPTWTSDKNDKKRILDKEIDGEDLRDDVGGDAGKDDKELIKNGAILEEAWAHFSGHRIGVLLD